MTGVGISNELKAYLKTPWAVGVVPNNIGITFLFLTHPRENDGKHLLVYLETLRWLDDLPAIIACFAVIRVRSSPLHFLFVCRY